MPQTIEDEYFDWLTSIVLNDEELRANYTLLLKKLHQINFSYVIANDYNRLIDGVRLRDRFAYIFHKEKYEMINFDCNKCSILEMLVALSLRIEEDIMQDANFGNRVGYWFQRFLINLHIEENYNENYNDFYIENQIKTFLLKNYDYYGEGGNIIIIPNTKFDLRTQNIWQQVNNWCNYILEEEEHL